MKKLFFLFALFAVYCCCQAVSAQTYEVTEQQLQKLETIYQNSRANNQKLLDQVNELNQTVQGLKTESENLKKDSALLKTQLQQERNSTKNLNESLTKYETSLANSEAQRMDLIQDVAERDYKINKLKRACVCLTAVVIFLLLVMAASLYFNIGFHK